VNLERLYLDYNATSPLSQSVNDWLKSGDFLFANPSSQHSDGKASRKCINEARAHLFKVFGLNEKTHKLFFHSGATEAFHNFAYSLSETARLAGRELLICFSRVDHPAVVSLEDKYYGPHVKFFELQRDESLQYKHDVNYEALKDKKDNNPDLMILYHHLWVHNETGLVSPLDDLDRFRGMPDLYIHVDAVQSPGKIVDWQKLSGGDIWTFSAHKFGALKGIGFSFFRAEMTYHPMICGGGQQGSLRSGTENVLGIKSVSLALNDLVSIDVKSMLQVRTDFLNFLIKHLGSKGTVVDGAFMASNTIFFYLHHLSSDIALALFDLHGIEISAGSACSSGAARPSGVLVQMGVGEYAKNGLRISLPLQMNQEFLNSVKNRFLQVLNKL
jgi:cysteine desulfurase